MSGFYDKGKNLYRKIYFLTNKFIQLSCMSNKTQHKHIYILLLFYIKIFYGFQHYLDITFFDESEYLLKGISIPNKIYNDWGPTYNLWYFFINSFTQDPITTYYVNYVLLNTLIPLLLFFLLVRFSINNKLALLLALFFLLDSLSYNNFTYVSHFCLVIILCTFIIITYVSSNETKAIVAITGAFVCAFARQEFLLNVVLITLLWLYIVIRQRKINFNTSYIILVFVVGILYYLFDGISFKAQGMDRSYFAFMQHFYVNYCVWTKKLLTLDEFRNLKLFGESKTMLACMINDPILFTKHLFTNIANYIVSMIKYLEDYVLPPVIFKSFGKIKHLPFLIFCGYTIYLLFKKKVGNQIKTVIAQNSFQYILVFIFFISSFFSIFFIFPEKHYIILQFIWWILLIALIYNHQISLLHKPYVFYCLILILLIIFPTSNKITFFQHSRTRSEVQPNLKTILYLNKHNDKKQKIIFSTERGFTPYLATNYKELFLEVDSLKPYMTSKDTINLTQYLYDKKIDIIYMNEKMQDLINFANFKDKNTFLKNPEIIGYSKQTIDTILHKSYLLIKQ